MCWRLTFIPYRQLQAAGHQVCRVHGLWNCSELSLDGRSIFICTATSLPWKFCLHGLENGSDLESKFAAPDGKRLENFLPSVIREPILCTQLQKRLEIFRPPAKEIATDFGGNFLGRCIKFAWRFLRTRLKNRHRYYPRFWHPPLHCRQQNPGILRGILQIIAPLFASHFERVPTERGSIFASNLPFVAWPFGDM